MDLCTGGELFFHLQRCRLYTEDLAKFYFVEILLGLDNVHENEIIYRDLKPENILIDVEGHIKLADFGLSKKLFLSKGILQSHSFCGSPEYMSPEMLLGEGHNRTLDFYSLGTLLFEMLTGLPPHYSNNRIEMYQRIVEDQIQYPNRLNPVVIDLLKKLLVKDPTQRYAAGGVGAIMKHPWFNDVNWEDFKKKRIEPPWRPDLYVCNFDSEYV